MKKITILAILLIIIGFQLYSQKPKDVLYLKNGSVINGTLIGITDNQYKIRTADQSIFVFPSADVDKYVKEIPGFNGRKKDGMGFALEGGFLIGSQRSSYALPFSFNCIVSYATNTRNIFGIGSGVEFLGEPFNPIFFEYKRLISEGKTTPFIFVRGGGLLHLSKDHENSNPLYPQYNYQKDFHGGASFAIGTGISWAKEGFENYLSFAYRYTRTSYAETGYNHYDVTYEQLYNRLEVKFGFRF
jgi:hypothetical protein